MFFDWDAQKSKSNFIKHGIDFGDVVQVFNRPHLTKEDKRQDYGERRWITLGKLNDTAVVVVFTVRKNVIRIISARKANKNERSVYYEKFEE